MNQNSAGAEISPRGADGGTARQAPRLPGHFFHTGEIQVRSVSERAAERRARNSRLVGSHADLVEKTSALFQSDLETAAATAGQTLKQYVMGMSRADYRSLKLRRAKALRGAR
jgi:hypothetical protein